jgi:hypothetical protein
MRVCDFLEEATLLGSAANDTKLRLATKTKDGHLLDDGQVLAWYARDIHRDDLDSAIDISQHPGEGDNSPHMTVGELARQLRIDASLEEFDLRGVQADVSLPGGGTAQLLIPVALAYRVPQQKELWLLLEPIEQW